MKVVIGLLGAAAVGVAIASSDGVASYEVAANKFEVPTGHLFDHPIWFIGQPSRDSFVFLFEPNPNADQIPKHRVLVENLNRYCPGDASQLLRIACGSETPTLPEGPPFEKVQDGIASYSSDWYAVKAGPIGNEKPARRQLAFCQLFGPNPAKPQRSTLCTTFWSYKGMMLTFSFDESELAAMPALKREAERLLDTWKIS